ncbi:MAG: hypothetical protein LBB24_00205 [Rickettsiales bacterium]|jgi:hypothetical protein|nr:hypothetical protein [Rickettsiales bacterium]
MFLTISLAIVAIILILSILIYRKGQRDGEKALIIERMASRRKYRGTKDMDSIRGKLKNGEF